MSQLSLSLDSSLLVRDAHGQYLPATAGQILDAARQVIDQQVRRGAAFNSPQVVRDFLRTKLAGFDHEVFAVLLLDSQHRLIEYVEMFRGTIDQTSVYPREAVRESLAHNAAAVIFSHNHPSGTPEPSRSNEALTRRLREALALVDVRVLDHSIVAGNDTTSMAEQGLM